LDGLRAVAIGLVLFGHAIHYQSDIVPHRLARMAGWGVDLFFAISGFIITLLLVREWRKGGSISLRHFYFRRALRILPPYAAFLGFVFLAEQLGYHELQAAERWGLLTLTLNWVHIQQVSTLHIWSLSLEEQFYLLWPFVLLWLGPRRALGFAIGLVALTPLIRLLTREFLPEMPFFVATPNRLDGLMAGCAVALLATGVAGIRLPPLGRRGPIWFVVLAVGVFVFREVMEITPRTVSSLFYYSGIALLMAGLVWAAVSTEPSWLTRVLHHPVAVGIGTLSYSLYLWQQPFLYWKTDNLVGRFAIIGVLAVASYYLIERPLLRWRLGREARGPARLDVRPGVTAGRSRPRTTDYSGTPARHPCTSPAPARAS